MSRHEPQVRYAGLLEAVDMPAATAEARVSTNFDPSRLFDRCGYFDHLVGYFDHLAILTIWLAGRRSMAETVGPLTALLQFWPVGRFLSLF